MQIINPYRFGGSSSLLTGLVSWWSLDETSGTRYDSHGSVDLTDNATVGYAAGKQGNAADFEISNNEYLNNTSAADLDNSSGDLTVSLWFNAESFSSSIFQRLFHLTQSTGAAIFAVQLFKSTGSPANAPYVLAYNTSRSGEFQASTTSPSTGVWYHVIASWDSSADEMSIRVNNGTPSTKIHTGGGPMDTGIVRVYLGSESTLAQKYDGMIDEVGFWHRLLTEDEQSALYNSGSGIGYPG